MASSANDDDRPGPTPVPPRGGKRKPNRPPAKRATPQSAAGRAAPASGRAVPASRPALDRPAPGRPVARTRPADNRRAAVAQRRRRNQTLMAGGVIGLIVAVVAVIIVIKVTGSGTKSNTAVAAVPDSTVSTLSSSVSLPAMAAAATNYRLTAVGGGYPTVLSGPKLTTGGKPELLYLGAEYCPYCATERWPMVLALSKFGTFHNLSTIHSSAADVFPNTATFTFYKSTYTSQYLTFTPVEEQTMVQGVTLQTATPIQQAIAGKYDPKGSIPFVYFNGRAGFEGAEVDASLLGGKSFQQIVDSIQGGKTPLASSVIADAGVIVSHICHMTGGKPGNVCSLFPKPITR